MANLLFSFNAEYTPICNPCTLVQLVAAANQRVLVTACEMDPLGSTGASVPLKFVWRVQTDAGCLVDASGNLVKTPPQAAETIQTGALYRSGAGAEPTAGDDIDGFALHQQGARVWVPRQGPLVMPGGTRLGLVYVQATYVACNFRVYCEE